MQQKVEISRSRSCASRSVCRVPCSCSDPALTWNACVHAHKCSVAELWTAADFPCVCVCIYIYIFYTWCTTRIWISFSSVAPESGLSWKHLLSCIMNLFECWLLGGKLWKLWILLPFPTFSFPHMFSAEGLETLADFTPQCVLAVLSL